MAESELTSDDLVDAGGDEAGAAGDDEMGDALDSGRVAANGRERAKPLGSAVTSDAVAPSPN